MGENATVIFAGVAAAGGAIGAFLGVIGFWLRFSDQIARARARADAAEKDGAEAKVLADQAHNRISAMTNQFGDYREMVAKEYVSKDAMRELKADLVGAINDIGDKLDQVLAHERRP